MIVTVRTLAIGTNPHYRIPLKVSVTRQLEQFHFEIALTPNTVRRAAKTDPTGGPWGRACSPKGAQASRATRRGFRKNRIFCRNDPFETCSVSKAICSRLRMRHVHDRMEKVSR